MSKSRVSTAAIILSAALSIAGCNSLETGGALKVAKDTLDGEPIISDEEFQDRKPNTSHIPDDETSGGFIQFKAQ